MSATPCVFMYTLLPEETVTAEDAVTEKDLEQSLPDMIWGEQCEPEFITGYLKNGYSSKNWERNKNDNSRV